MNKVAWITALAAIIALPATAQFGGTQGARGGVPDASGPGLLVTPGAGTIISEDFADITTLPAAGWFEQNNSNPIGTTNFFQGNPVVFNAQAGAPDAYLATNFNNTGGAGDISNWMLTPVLDLSQFDTFSFWTRTVTGNTFPDRMEIRLSTAGASTNVGTLATDVGDFSNLLLAINPALMVGGYPDVWTQFVINRADLPTTAGTGRIAFRYYVTNAGPAGSNSNYIGIDTVEYVENIFGPPIPTVSTLGLLLLAALIAGAAVFVLRRG